MLLERDIQLRELEEALEEAKEGRGRAVGIEAAAGLGKTRLLEEARRSASQAGVRVLAGRATELEQDFPFALVRQLLETEIFALSGEERERVFEGAGAARGALGLGADEQRGNDAFAVLHALYWVTASLADRMPLLLAIDDAHSADAASLDYLGFLLPRLEELPVLIVLTGRPDEPDPSGGFRRIMTDGLVRHMTLRPLSAEASAALMREDLGIEPEPPFATACFEVSGGNPFLLRELSRTVVQRGVEPASKNAEQVRELVPERVAHTVLMRLERLPSRAGAIARALAVLGEGADLRLVAELGGVDLPAARAAADELRAAAIFEVETSLRFIHPLVRNAIYSSMAIEERGRLHSNAASLLRANGANAEQVATQLLVAEARGDGEAVGTLVQAGEKALAAGAPRSSVAYLTRALREPPAEDEKAAILGPLITASLRAADHATLAAIEADVLAELEREPSLRIEWAIELATWMGLSGRLEDAVSMLMEAVDVALEEEKVEQAFQFEAQLRTLSMALPSAPEVNLERYRNQIDPETSGGRLAAALEAGTAAASGSAAEAIDASKRALANDGAIFSDESDFTAPAVVVFALVVAEEFEAARRGAEQALTAALQRGATNELSLARSLNGLVGWAFGDLSAAEADLRQGIELARHAGLPPLLIMSTAVLIEVLVERDELASAEAELRGIGLAEGPLPDNPLFTLLHYTRGRLFVAKGETEAAVQDFAGLSSLADASGFGGGPALMACPDAVRSLLAVGRPDDAREWAANALDAGERWGTNATIAHVLRGVAATRPGPEGIEVLEEAASMLEGSAMLIGRAHVQLDLGMALRRQDRRADARAPLREAFELARRCGAARIAKRAHSELQATGEKVRRYSPVGVESLTPSERRVAELAASGMTNRQIAQSLFVTVKTVEAHLSAAYDKLDIGSRRQLPAALGGNPSGT